MCRIYGYIASLLATAIWAGNFIVARALAGAIPPWQLNLVRWLLALFVLLPFGLRHLKGSRRAIMAHLPYLTLMALIGISLMNGLIYEAGYTTSSLNMALIMPATPAVILILAALFFHDHVSLREIVGMCLAMCGILVLLSRGELSTFTRLNFTPGDLWCLGGMLCFALYSVCMRKRPEALSPLVFNIAVFALGVLGCVPMALYEFVTQPAWSLTSGVAIGIAYAGIGCSALAFWLWTIGIDRIGPVRAGLVYYTLPLFAGVMANVLLAEHVSGLQIGGGALIIGGIVIASKRI